MPEEIDHEVYQNMDENANMNATDIPDQYLGRLSIDK